MSEIKIVIYPLSRCLIKYLVSLFTSISRLTPPDNNDNNQLLGEANAAIVIKATGEDVSHLTTAWKMDVHEATH